MGGGKSKKLSKRLLSDDEFEAALAEFDGGSDRVAAIMGAQLVQNTLEATLVVSLKDPSDTAKLFTDLRAPLATFEAQVLFGKATGLFGAEIAADLHSIRKTRNEFAHALLNLDFKHPRIVGMCARLKVYADPSPANKEHAACRGWFAEACISLTVELMRIGNEIIEQRIAEKKAGIAMGLLRAQQSFLDSRSLSDFLYLVPASVKGGD